MSDETKEIEENKPITVRADTLDERKILEEAAKRVKRKLGPYLFWASIEYTREHFRELFPK